MNQTTKEFRKKIAEEFINALSEKKLDWKKNWASGGMQCPVNAATGKKYNGINRFSLMLVQMEAMERGDIPDNRWATFKQIKDKGWSVKKNVKGHKVEYWQPYDFEGKNPITWEEYLTSVQNPEKNVGLIAKYYYVFNGQDIKGIPAFELKENKDVLSDEMISKISTGLEVSLANDGGDCAFYRPSDDSIHLPKKESFFSTYDYNSTALHELSHATGAKHRLNRDIKNHFGSEKYAYEELVAEISACFMGEHLQIEQTEEHVKNHKAYVQSWIRDIQKKPDVLIHAIRDAGRAADLLEYHAGILSKEEYQKSLKESMEISQEQVREQSAGSAQAKSTENNLKPFIKQKSITLPLDREFHLKCNGYKPTALILKKMEILDELTGKNNTLKDIHVAVKEHTLRGNPEAEKVAYSIGKMLRDQELLKQASLIR